MLRYKADRRSLAFVATYFALFGFQWFYRPSEFWLAVPLFVATCVFSWFCAVITHNTIHCAVFEKRWMNKAFQVVLSLTYGSPVSSYVSGHNLSHHRYTQRDRDVMRTTKVAFRWNWLNLLMFVPFVAVSIARNDAIFASRMKAEKPRWFRQFVIESAVCHGLTILLFLIDWQAALIYWLLPHLWAAWGIIAINYLQHDGCDPDSPYNHSRNFTGRVFGWWTFDNGFHGIHHMHPNLHWSLARATHERELAPHIHPALDQPSIAAYAFRTFVWPGRRQRFDGTQLRPPDPVPDRSWIEEVRPNELPRDALGVEG